MEIELAYGRGSRKLRLKKKPVVVTAPEVPGVKNPGETLLNGLDHPIGSPPLRECLRKGRCVIVTSDKTRVVQYPLFLPHLLDYLNRAGIPDREITLIVGLGSHEGHTQEEINALFGEEVVSRVEITEHDCRDRGALIEVGRTRHGTPILLNQKVVEADNVILTGAIKFHAYSGFSGGRKAVLPGVAAFESIQNNHKMALSDRRCSLGRLEGNPIHEEMVDAAQTLNPSFLVNVVCNESKQIVRFFAGHWQKAHEEGCRSAGAMFCPEVQGRADLVITSVGGYPDDINLYQSLKAVENTAVAVRDGGVLMLLAECQDGFGPEEFLEWFDGSDPAAIRERLQREFSIPGYVSLGQRRMAERIRMILVSSLPQADVTRTPMIPAATPEEGLEKALECLPPDYTTYVFPLGGTHVLRRPRTFH